MADCFIVEWAIPYVELTLINGMFMTSEVESDMIFNAIFKYSGQIDFYDMISSGTSAIMGNTEIKIENLNNQLAFSNLPIDSEIKIYSLNGVLIAEHTSTSGNLQIKINNGTYIVCINTYTCKISI